MNWLDVLVLVTVGIRGWSGYRRGFISQAFELAGLIAGLFFAVRYYYPLQIQLSRYAALPVPVLAVASFFLILLGVMLAARLLGSICTQMVNVPGLGTINALSGALAGALVALVTIAFFLSVLQLFSFPPVEAALSASVLAPYLDQYLPALLDLVEGCLPDDAGPAWPRPGGPVPLERREL
ncbi:MAG: CvpA family protein [bacterium]|nr:CvpA family protein [Bacillota bacterium]HHW56016.1 CvpA family protein [Bacillota bacterium]